MNLDPLPTFQPLDLDQILAIPEDQITNTPHNMQAPQDVIQIGTMSTSERKLYHYMIECRINLSLFLSQYHLSTAGFLKCSSNRHHDPEVLDQLTGQSELYNRNRFNIENIVKNSEKMFWSSIQIRLSLIIPNEDIGICVYGEDLIGLTFHE